MSYNLIKILSCTEKNNNLLFAEYDEDSSENAERKYSKAISDYLGKKLTVVELKTTEKNVEQLIENIAFVARNTEELISDYTFLPTYQLSKLAKENGYSVMLSGMGGDEVFCGYPRYLVLKKHSLIKFVSPFLKLILQLKLFPKKMDKKFERLVSYISEKHWPLAYSRLLGYFNQRELKGMFTDEQMRQTKYKNKLDKIADSFKGNSKNKVKLAQHYDFKGFLSHNLLVSDKASMLASIELRVPLLDEAVIAHGLSLNSTRLLKGTRLKAPLFKLLSSLYPKTLINRPKIGFNPPLDGIIEKIGKERLYLELKPIDTIINMQPITEIIDQHFSKKMNHTYKLWQLLYFSHWLQEHSL